MALIVGLLSILLVTLCSLAIVLVILKCGVARRGSARRQPSSQTTSTALQLGVVHNTV